MLNDRFAQIPRLEVRDAELARVLLEPIRMSIVEACALKPRSAKELAELIGVPVTRLYYHLNALEKHGFLGIAATRRVGNLTEKLYMAAARDIDVNLGLAENDGAGAASLPAAGDILDRAKRELAALSNLRNGAGPRYRSVVSREFARLSPERTIEFERKLRALLEEFAGADEAASEREGGITFCLTAAMYPLFEDLAAAGKQNGVSEGDIHGE